jgi:hypothetical protein
MSEANELRGEVDVEFEGVSFVLRPSFEAVQAAEKATGKGLMQLYNEACDGALGIGQAAIVTTELIRAWGRATDNNSARAVNPARVGELIHETGLMNVLARLAIVLGWAVTGGCKADGTPKARATGTTTDATPVAASQD